MNQIKAFLIFSLIFTTIALSISYGAATIDDEGDDDELPSLSSEIVDEDDNTSDTTLDQDDDDEFDLDETPLMLGGVRRILSRKKPKALTCNKNPKICRVKGSPGRNCCKKKCVNFRTDRLNCGQCGKKCRYGEMCCKGKCVNVSFNKKHCGSCNNKCKKGQACVYGLCNYAY